MGRRGWHLIGPLTSMRFFAAFRVMMYHLVKWETKGFWLRGLMGTPVGVSYFFVSSGFLITYTYSATSDAGELSPRVFWLKRCARILPVYYLGLAAALPLLRGQQPTSLAKDAVTVLLVQAWSPTTAAYWNYAGWALSALAFFYLVLPLALRVTRGLSPRTLALLAALAWGVSLATSLTYVALNPDGLGAIDSRSRGFWLDVLKFNPLARLPEFLLGMFAARLWSQAGDFGKRATAVFCGVGLALLVGLLLGQYLPYVVVNNGLWSPFLALLLVSLTNESAVARLLSRKWLVTLGQSSFCLYMLHAPLFSFVKVWMPGAWEQHSHIVKTAIVVPIVLISLAGYRFIEAPATAWLKSVLLGSSAGRRAPASQAAE